MKYKYTLTYSLVFLLLSVVSIWRLSSSLGSLESLTNSMTNQKILKSKTFRITVSHYNPEVAQTDSSPCISATGEDICIMKQRGVPIIALSRDLVPIVGDNRPKPFKYGDTVLIRSPDGRCNGTYRVSDNMNARFTNFADIFKMDRSENMGNCEDSVMWKVRTGGGTTIR